MYQHYDVAAAVPRRRALRDAASRVMLSLRLIGALHPGQEVAAVSHAAMVRHAITEATDGPRAEWRRTLPNGSITVIDVFDDEVARRPHAGVSRLPDEPRSSATSGRRCAAPPRAAPSVRVRARRPGDERRRPLPEFLIIGTKRGGRRRCSARCSATRSSCRCSHRPAAEEPALLRPRLRPRRGLVPVALRHAPGSRTTDGRHADHRGGEPVLPLPPARARPGEPGDARRRAHRAAPRPVDRARSRTTGTV